MVQYKCQTKGGDNLNSNEQIKDLRKALNMTQTEFGERISVSRDAINSYERLRANVPPPTELAIASEFGVNIDWLRTGTGEMFAQTPETFIDELAQKYDLDDFIKRIVLAYMELNDDQRAIVKDFIMKITPPPAGDVEIYRAARSSDNHAPEIGTMSADDYQKLTDAPKTTSENSDL